MAVLRTPKFMRKGTPSHAVVLKTVPTDHMNAVFGTALEGIRVAPFALLEDIDLNEIMVWCVNNGIYQVPTQELVDVLRGLVGNHKAIEICAGHGAVGRALGIPLTDSHMQTLPQMRALYEAMRQPVIEPPSDVEKLEALEAVRAHDPEVVVGCFVTQLGTPDVEQSSPVGVDELALMRHPSVHRYVMVGNAHVHGKKVALQQPHKVLHSGAPWLVSRGSVQSLNRIYVWEC
jgi:hypothetical protein